MISLFGNVLLWLDPPWSELFLVLVASGCGAIVGAEREAKEKTAGLRTMILVSLGAAVFTRLSAVLGTGHAESSRIAAQIVTGVGFLGAGTILRGAGGVRGMTTAATIWAVAAIGMVVGAGYPAGGVVLSLGILVVLTSVTRIESRYLGPCRGTSARLVFQPNGGKTAVTIVDILDSYRISDGSRRTVSLSNELLEIRFRYCSAHKHHREFLTKLAAPPNVTEIECDAELAAPEP